MKRSQAIKVSDSFLEEDKELEDKISDKFLFFSAKMARFGCYGKIKNTRGMRPLDKYRYITNIIFKNLVLIDKETVDLIELIEEQCRHNGHTSADLANASVDVIGER